MSLYHHLVRGEGIGARREFGGRHFSKFGHTSGVVTHRSPLFVLAANAVTSCKTGV